MTSLDEPFSHFDDVAGAVGLGEALKASLARWPQGQEIGVALLLLSDQAFGSPDYAAIGKGGWHPTSRRAYRERSAVVFTHDVSRLRQQRSREAVFSDMTAIVNGEDPVPILVKAFAREIGAGNPTWRSKPSAILAALKAELLMPLRALHECDVAGEVHGQRGPEEAVKSVVTAVTKHIAEGDFREWVYSQGNQQLQGLSQEQLQGWVELHALDHERKGGIRFQTREEDGIDLAWATKIGGPSHGFDHEGRCLLPLLCNARHRVILVGDATIWPHNAVARCHFRLLHRASDRHPVLHLEPLMTEFEVESVAPRLEYQEAVLRHAVAKADLLGIPLLLGSSNDPSDPDWLPEIKGHPLLRESVETLVLMPSNGVFEASDSLTKKHDWVQQEEEITEPLQRWLYTPSPH